MPSGLELEASSVGRGAVRASRVLGHHKGASWTYC